MVVIVISVPHSSILTKGKHSNFSPLTEPPARALNPRIPKHPYCTFYDGTWTLWDSTYYYFGAPHAYDSPKSYSGY